jgi:hypothetical protein
MSAAPSLKTNEPVPEVQKKLRIIVHDVLSHDLPMHQVRGQLMDWANDSEEAREELVRHARAIVAGKPIASYVTSSLRMAELLLAIGL